MQDKLKVSTYIRVSTGRQAREGDSLEEQESELKKFCEYKNYLVHKMHIERGRSAKDTNRPEYQKLLEEIKEKKINAVVVKKLDRLSRSLLDFEDFMRIAQENDVEFISLKENFDTTNAMGKAMLRIALVFAQLEREQNSERVVDVMTYRAEQGLFNGGTNPFGYDIVNKELLPHKQERKVIELMFNKFIETKSTALVARELNVQGQTNRNGKTWKKNQIDYMLRNPIYIGKIQWNNSIYNGIHQAIISEAMFNEVQEIFNNRKYHRESKIIQGLLRGLLYCGNCNSLMNPNYTRKKNHKEYYYYRCNPSPENKDCPNNYLRMDEANEKVMNVILEFASTKSLKKLQAEIENKNAEIYQRVNVIEALINELNLKLKAIRTKKEKYLDSLVANNFSSQERRTINSKIEEYTIEEKRTSGELYKQELELSQKKDNLLSIDEFKKEVIYLKVNFKELNNHQLREWLLRNVKAITYNKSNIEVKFKFIDL